MEEEAKAAARRASAVRDVRKTRDRNGGYGCRPCDTAQWRSGPVLVWGTTKPVRHMPQRGQGNAGAAWIQPGMRRGRDADRFQSSVEERQVITNTYRGMGQMYVGLRALNRAGSRDLVPDKLR